MAEYGEWTRKGATLSDVTAEAEYGVNSDGKRYTTLKKHLIVKFG